MMKRLVWLVLLLSLGLNLGLGYRLLRGGDSSPDFMPPPGRDHWRSGQGRANGHIWPGQRDSTAWSQVMERRLERIARRLGLSPDQADHLRSIQKNSQESFGSQRWRLDQARDRLHSLMASGAAPADSLRRAIREVGIRQARLDSLVTETMLEEMEILNEEQRGRYLKLLPVLRGDGPGRRGGPKGRARHPEPEGSR